MRYVRFLGWAVVFTVTTLLFACAANDARMSHSDPTIGPDVTMAQLTEEDSLVNREMEPKQRVIMLPATREEVAEREKMLYFLEGDLDRRENSLAINTAWLEEKEAQLAQREDELELRENALVINRAWLEEQKARIAELENKLEVRENALAINTAWQDEREAMVAKREDQLSQKENALVINQAWLKHQQMQFEHTKHMSEDILVMQDVGGESCYANVTVPAEYLAVASKVLVQAQDEDEGIPDVYQTVTKHVKVSDEHTSLEQVVCASQLTDNTVRNIQRALSLSGYNAGPIDGVLGPQTIAAVKEYQKDHGLIVADYVTVETARTLGVKF